MELAGTLIEFDPGHAGEYSVALPPAGRLGVWLWRSWRWFIHDLGHILSLCLGAGLAAGTMLSLLRGLDSIAGGVRVGAYMATSFFYTAILAAALAFGLSLSEPVLLRRRGGQGKASFLQPLGGVEALSIGLGTLFFGTAHVLIAWANDVLGNPQYPRGLMVLAGYLVGLGLSLALYHLPEQRLHQNALKWALRLIVAALFPVLAQLMVFASGQDWGVLALDYTGGDLSNLLGRFTRVSQWLAVHARSFTLIDAGLVGMILMAGVGIGLSVAEALYAQWQAAVHPVQD